MDWNSGLSAIYELREVDPVSWMDLGSLDFTAGTITRTDSNLIESASLKMTESVREGWVRIYLKARQAGTGTRVPVFTGLAMTPQRVLDGYWEDNTIKCYSVLKPAEDTLTPRGYYVPAGAPGAQLVAQLLSVGAAPVTFDDYGPELMEPIVTEDSDTNLSVAWKILDAIGWRILLSGDGRIRVCPAATEPVVEFNPSDNDAVEPKITDSDDWFSCPNCLRVVSGSRSIVMKDEDPDSVLSIASRKAARGGSGEIWKQETASSLGSDESLAEYAMRKLKEAQGHARELKYYRRYNPDVNVTDIVHLHYPGIGIDGNFRIRSQTVTLDYAPRVDEKVVAI